MRVLYLDQYFSTREGISGTRSYEFARLLVRWGHRVTVLTTATQYAGRDSQRRFLERETVEGIRVLSLAIGYSSRMNYGRRMLAFLGYLIAASGVGLLLPRADVVFATSTPLTVGVPGLLISWLRGGRFVFEVRDLWPDAPIQLGVLRSRLVIAAMRGLEKLLYRRARRIVALSPGMADGIAARGVDPEKIAMIPNASDLDLADAAASPEEHLQRLGLTGKFVALYAGAMGPANDLDYLVDVADAARRIGGDAVHFLAVGDGPSAPAVRARAAALGLSNLTFLPPVSRREVGALMRAAGATLTLFADVPILSTNSPNKFFDSLACGRPTLVNSPGWTRELVENTGAGFFLPPDDPAEAARRIAALAADPDRARRMGEAARALAQERFDRRKLGRELEGVLRQAMEESPVQGRLGAGLKRLVDLVGAAVALLFLAPLLLLIAWAIRHDSPGPALFCQERVGRGGRIFRVFKFRTMIRDAASAGPGLNVEERDPRITRVGRILRDFSLDELPQLLNVLLGEMSLVGPRPALPEQARMYSPEQRRRLLVRPGITGWAQVNGRNALSWPERIALDIEYVDRLSLWLDLRILFRTVRVVLAREGLYEADGGRDDPFNRFEG